jgi:hypothetical protein
VTQETPGPLWVVPSLPIRMSLRSWLMARSCSSPPGRSAKAVTPRFPVFSAVPTAGPASSSFPAAADSPPAVLPAWFPRPQQPQPPLCCPTNIRDFSQRRSGQNLDQYYPGGEQHRHKHGKYPAKRRRQRTIPFHMPGEPYGHDGNRGDSSCPPISLALPGPGRHLAEYGGPGLRPRSILNPGVLGRMATTRALMGSCGMSCSTARSSTP